MDQNILEEIKRELNLGDVAYYQTIGSTNDLAKEWLKKDITNYSVIVADEQTKGRGRFSRKWYTAPNSALAFSVILTKGLLTDTATLSRYSGLGAISVCETLSNLTSSNVKIKWPNDVLIDEKKVCGILVETYWQGNNLGGIVLGIGINISDSSFLSKELLNYPATYLEKHTTKKISRAELLKKILIKIFYWEKNILTKEFIQVWNHNLAFKGRVIQISNQNNLIEQGRLEGISDNGEIIVSRIDGTISLHNSSEITVRNSTQET